MSIKPRPNDQVDRPLPSALDAEKGILGSILQRPHCLDSLTGITAGSFHHPSHAEVYSAMIALREQGKPIDQITLSDEMERRGTLANIGGRGGLADLQIKCPTSLNVSASAEILQKKKALRDYITISQRGMDAAYAGDFPAGEITQLATITPETGKPEDLFTDLSPYLSGEIELEKPDIAETWDADHHLFYSGRINEIHGEPGTGKTNILLAAVIAELEKGQKILYIDPEDTPRGFTARLRSLGASPEQIRDQVFYLHNPTPEQIVAAQKWAEIHHPSLVVLDGMAESIAAQGYDEDKAKDILPFLARNMRPFAEVGAAVVIADHVAKSSESNRRFARGSGAKAGRYDGVIYDLVLGKAYSPTQEGFVRLKIAKDRNGGIGAVGMISAEAHFLPSINGRTIVVFREPRAKQEQNGEPWKPTEIMGKIIAHLEVVGEASTTELRSLGGKTEYINQAIQCLKAEGKILCEKRGRVTMHFLPKVEAAA